MNVPSNEIVTPQPPLNEPLKDLAPVSFATSQPGSAQTRITTLSNGLRVASEDRFGQFCSIGGEWRGVGWMNGDKERNDMNFVLF